MPEAAATQTPATTTPPNGAKPGAVETPVETPPAAGAEGVKPDNDPRFALYAKKERALVAREREIKRLASESEKKFASQQAELEQLRAATKKAADFRTRVKLTPLEALQEEYGLSYEAITEAKLNGGKPTGPWAAARELREEVTTLRQTQEERFAQMRKEQADARESEQREAMEAFRSDCEAFVDGNEEAFPLIASLGAKSLVAQEIEREYDASGKRLSYQAAAESVEKQLDENIEKGQQARAKKLAAKTPQETSAPGKQTPAAQPRTLSNELTGSTPRTTSSDSEADRMRRAVEVLTRARETR